MADGAPRPGWKATFQYPTSVSNLTKRGETTVLDARVAGWRKTAQRLVFCACVGMPQFGRLARHAEVGLDHLRPVFAIVEEIGVIVRQLAVKETKVGGRCAEVDIRRNAGSAEPSGDIAGGDNAALADSGDG